MMSYKDMTFCKSDCTNLDCHRILTTYVKQDSAKWWENDEAPIAVRNFSKTCKDYTNA